MPGRGASSVKTGCRCGAVQFELIGAPIASATCHCRSCHKAGELLATLDGATPILDPDGGTPLVMMRVDRSRCLKGQDYLAEFRLSPKSPTRRIVATCCNTPVFLDFEQGHWLSWFWHPMQATGIPHPTKEVNRDGKFPFSFMLRMMANWAGTGSACQRSTT